MQLTVDEEDRITRNVLSSSFSTAPFLDRFLKRDDVTDVFINGCDDVRLGLIDGTSERAEPFARSDDELIEMVQTTARRGGHMEREFTPNRPVLDLQLPDGSRLAAVAWISKRPYVAIRRHLFVDADQRELVRRACTTRASNPSSAPQSWRGRTSWSPAARASARPPSSER